MKAATMTRCSERPADLAPRDLPARWRSTAETVRPYAESAARAFDRAADELERALHTEVDELLTLTDAAEMSGYSPDHLGRLIKQGVIPNAGRPHAPRIRRGHVPRRPVRIAARREGAYDVGADARALAVRRRETAA